MKTGEAEIDQLILPGHLCSPNFGTEAQAKGLNIVEVSKRLGHQEFASTTNYLYSDTSKATEMINKRNEYKWWTRQGSNLRPVD